MNLLATSSTGQNSLSEVGLAPTLKPGHRQRTLLLAEDNDDLRLLMECSLSSLGYVVVACADAQLASAAYYTHAIHALVTDFEMPGRTGLELARELTALQPGLPVLIVTGSMLSAEIMEELADRRWVYIPKPSKLSLIESTLKSLVGEREPFIA